MFIGESPSAATNLSAPLLTEERLSEGSSLSGSPRGTDSTQLTAEATKEMALNLPPVNNNDEGALTLPKAAAGGNKGAVKIKVETTVPMPPALVFFVQGYVKKELSALNYSPEEPRFRSPVEAVAPGHWPGPKIHFTVKPRRGITLEEIGVIESEITAFAERVEAEGRKLAKEGPAVTVGDLLFPFGSISINASANVKKKRAADKQLWEALKAGNASLIHSLLPQVNKKTLMKVVESILGLQPDDVTGGP